MILVSRCFSMGVLCSCCVWVSERQDMKGQPGAGAAVSPQTVGQDTLRARGTRGDVAG